MFTSFSDLVSTGRGIVDLCESLEMYSDFFLSLVLGGFLMFDGDFCVIAVTLAGAIYVMGRLSLEGSSSTVLVSD